MTVIDIEIPSALTQTDIGHEFITIRLIGHIVYLMANIYPDIYPKYITIYAKVNSALYTWILF